MASRKPNLPPIVVVLVTAAVMYGSARLAPVATVHTPGQFAVAMVIAATGVILALAGVSAFRRHATTVNPMHPNQASTLVTGGVYRLSRNPMYLGFLILLVGWGLWLGNLVALAALPLFIGYLNSNQILPEEEALRDRFGVTYTEYSSRVRRWL